MMGQRIREEIQTFLTALGFFTRIPVPATSFSEARLARCAYYLPLTGWLVGGAGALIFLASRAFLPFPVALLLAMASTAWITGGLHEDGLADFCDGFGGGFTRERILEIMKDSRLGTYGALGLLFVLPVKWLCLQGLPADRIALILIAGHALSRAFALIFLRTHAYVGGAASKAGPLCSRLPVGAIVVILTTGLLPLILLRSPAAWLALLPLGVLYLWLGNLLTRRIGGFTGDCLGAAQQLAEALFYLVLLALGAMVWNPGGWSWMFS
jgi:adenosylcobinamide-GDP ribazoletransferase